MAIYEPVIYLIYIDVIARKIGTTAYLPIFLLAGLYIVAFYMITVFEAILQPKRPQTLGYGLLIEEIVKVGVALIEYLCSASAATLLMRSSCALLLMH